MFIGMWFNGGLGGVRFMVGLDFEGLFQPKLLCNYWMPTFGPGSCKKQYQSFLQVGPVQSLVLINNLQYFWMSSRMLAPLLCVSLRSLKEKCRSC